jgi:hypothetical protein
MSEHKYYREEKLSKKEKREREQKDIYYLGNSVSVSDGTGKEKIGIILVPTQDGTNVGQPFIPIYNDAANVWPVKNVYYRTTSVPIFAGGTVSSANVAVEVENFVIALMQIGVTKFILPSSTSILRAFLSGSPTLGGIPFNVRHPNGIFVTDGTAGATIGNYAGNGNLFCFQDYLSDQYGAYGSSVLFSQLIPGGKVYITFAINNGVASNDLYIRQQAWGMKDVYETAGFVVRMFSVSQSNPADPNSNYDFTNCNEYSGPLGADPTYDLPPPISVGQNLGTRVATDMPTAVVGGNNFTGAGTNLNNFSRNAINNVPSVFISGPKYITWQADSATFTWPQDNLYGGNIVDIVDYLNAESVKVNYPTTECGWDHLQGRAIVGYHIVEMFAFLATNKAYAGPENKLKFRANGVCIYPYVQGGKGTYYPANVSMALTDKIIRNPIWENTSANLSIVDPNGPLNQQFGSC